MKLERVQKLTGTIVCKGNLHIGGSKDTIEIGGMDNPVLKHPVTQEPYIPGSSLKGKMRCEMERRTEKGFKGKVCACAKTDCDVCVVFGSANNGNVDDKSRPIKNWKGVITGYEKFPALGPTRLIVRDAPLTDECRTTMREFVTSEDQAYMGVKYENSISRTTGKADNPRPIEFVPSGTTFALNISLLVYDVDSGKDYLETIKMALCAVEDTYLGGMGSRGYGQVKFEDLKLDGKAFEIRAEG